MPKHGGNQGGRPAKWNGDRVRQAQKYLETYEDLGHSIPTIEGFAYWIGVGKMRIYDWRKEHPKFKREIDKLLALQASELVNKGLSGEYNPTVARLILSTNHGYSEKVESETKHSGGVGIAHLFEKADENRRRTALPEDADKPNLLRDAGMGIEAPAAEEDEVEAGGERDSG